MSLAVTLDRIAALETRLAPAPAPAAPATAGYEAVPAGSWAVGAPRFAGVLDSAAATASPMVAIAEGEVGQAEQPPGSNDSPRIATYRQATAGAAVGPWCAYFASWVARQAGTPLGDQGQGFGSVDALAAWAQRTGRYVPDGPGVTPRPGDLILFPEHVGIVSAVLPDGRVQTVEGNSSDQVAQRVHAPGEAAGYVRIG